VADLPYDVAVVGGGPAGIAASMWAARYRRKVVLVDAGEQRNRWAEAAHGYLGMDGATPASVIARGRAELDRYPEVDVIDGRRVVTACRRGECFELVLDDGREIEALRVVLATGVRDVFPEVPGFERWFGRSIFTCPSCDGYEAQGAKVAVVGDSEEMAEFAIGLLDWAGSVVAVRESARSSSMNSRARGTLAVDDRRGRVVAIDADDAVMRGLVLADGTTVPCDVVFWLMRHEQQSDVARQLGCKISDEGCVVVGEDCDTTIPHVFAAGDMTPGVHLVQVAAAEGARAGIAAAKSLRGERGSPMSSPPAPDPEPFVDPSD
jgi:thioredoxin reductase